MNKYQRIVVIITAVNIALMFLFPPFLDNPLRRGVMPSFDGFYPLFSALGYKRLHTSLLTLEVMFVVINGMVAWLLLDRRTAQGAVPEFNYTRAIGLFAAANLAVMAMFPPFESYSGLSKIAAPSFDGFYFIIGDKRNRSIFIPVLYFEIILVIINCLVVWLLFNTVRRSETLAKEKILELAQELPPEALAEVSKTLGYRALHPVGEADATVQPGAPHLGIGPDRRRRQDPRYRGPERRQGGDRRLKLRSS